jgi:hypothetical protein
MMTLFYLIILTSVWVLGITIVTQPKMLLYNIRLWAEKRLDETGNRIFEPLVLCPWCMSSIHSVFGIGFGYVIGILSGFEWRIFLCYPIIVMGASIVCGMVWGWHKKVENQSKYFENSEILSHFDIRDRKREYKEKYK